MHGEAECLLFNSPKTKLSGLKICPKGPERTESIVPGSKSTKTARGTYFPPKIEKKRKSVERPRDCHSHTKTWQLESQWIWFCQTYRLPHCSKRLFFPTGGQSHRDRYPLDRFHVRLRWLPRTKEERWTCKRADFVFSPDIPLLYRATDSITKRRQKCIEHNLP